MSFIMDYIYGIQTKTVTNFFQRWTAVISVIFVYLSMILWVWNSLEVDFSPPRTQRRDVSQSTTGQTGQTVINRGNLNGFFYFSGLGINKPSVNYNDGGEYLVDPHVTADRCRLFGEQCMGFDTKGSLFLEKDKGIATLQPFKEKDHGFYLKDFENPPPANSGLPPTKASKTMCDELQGVYHKYYQTCSGFNPSVITDLTSVTRTP